MTEKRSVSIAPRYWLETVRRDYHDWRFAWVREAAQNSLDAGATHIDAHIIALDHDTCRLTWQDNGRGMSGDVLLNRLMAMGGSEKGTGGTGGFGVAKAILFFSQHSYTVSSYGGTIRGTAGEYVFNANETLKVPGTVLDVVVAAPGYFMEAHLRQWARATSTTCVFTLNGATLPTMPALPEPAGKLDPWATLYAVEPADYLHSGMIVRMNGQLMFAGYAPSGIPKVLIVEIAGNSLDYLTANRDGLRHEFSTQLRLFVEKLFRDPTAIVELEDGAPVQHAGRKGKLRIGKRDEEARDAKETPALDAVAAHTAREMVESLRFASAKTFDISEASESEELPDTYTLVIDNRLNRPVPDRFKPGTMTHHGARLLERWITTLQVCADVIGLSDMEIVPGYVFSKAARAMHVRKNGVTYILLNPVVVVGSELENYWKLSGDQFYELVCTAVHELTHAQGYHYHDEDFASRLGQNLAACMAEMTRIRRIAREA